MENDFRIIRRRICLFQVVTIAAPYGKYDATKIDPAVIK